MDYTREGGLPRLQPTSKPGFPAPNAEGGLRFTTARLAAIFRRNPTSKPRQGGTNGPGQRFTAERQR